MDDAQQISVRKRKAADNADNDDRDFSIQSTPRQPWLTSPLTLLSCSPKRQKLMRRPTKVLQPARPPPINRLGNDVEDIGIVKSNVHPGPATGSLLRNVNIARNLDDTPARHVIPPVFSAIPIDPNSPYIPSSYPLINRHTLKELHLDAILRNPQLRHDILFDPAITFRATHSKQKRYISDLYWAAISTELESGCTCVSFDTYGNPHPTVCVCQHVELPSREEGPVFVYSKVPFSRRHSRQRSRSREASYPVLTLRMPSRILALLEEFLEVFLLVIQPQANLDSYAPPQPPASHTPSYCNALFDPALVYQELSHNIFEPAGVFKAIGDVLKGHCAPMRDWIVSGMVAVAEDSTRDRKRRTVKAIRMCMDILELMKLDIANHQLQSLRPFLIRNAGQFELKSFCKIASAPSSPTTETPPEVPPPNDQSSLQKTQEWLQRAYSSLMKQQNLRLSPTCCFSDLSPNQKIYISVLKGIVDLVFDANSPSQHGSCPSPPTYPETTYLDHSRLMLLASDALDLQAVGIFLMLYRGLCSSFPPSLSPSVPHQVTSVELRNLKNEIRDITIGTSNGRRVGGCLSCRCSSDTDTRSAADSGCGCLKQDIVLQVARRAWEARCPAASSSTPTCPDSHLLNLASRWASTNLCLRSSMSTLVMRRLADATFMEVVKLAWPSRARDPMSLLWVGEIAGAWNNNTLGQPPPSESLIDETKAHSGLEALTLEIRCLAEKIARLGVVHLNAYLPLYEQEGFLTLDTGKVS